MTTYKSGLLDILSLTEAQADALLELLPEIHHQAAWFRGLHLYMRERDNALVIASDGWPGEYRIEPDGRVEYPAT